MGFLAPTQILCALTSHVWRGFGIRAVLCGVLRSREGFIVSLCGWQIRPTKSCGQGNDQLGCSPPLTPRIKLWGLLWILSFGDKVII
ncbi:hypothetical protein I7I53_12253 [Histoplasma capsulatum var. duboisii H88]|uniref:Uncharacterized protein n=1 Tax=Ajellomyces capsulatus (strain H88) TaxID=544711 RepID=A0A8A1M150_AJEC8|nr:hypothetical protein I7I53_12253 [Histoplasma capsulatum var. duboisii H88]